MVKKKSIYPYLLVAPALIIILCVVFIPVINAIGMSFQSYDLRRPNDIAFVGLANYIAAFKDALFWKALWKTILWVVFGVGFQFVFGFILALLLNKNYGVLNDILQKLHIINQSIPFLAQTNTAFPAVVVTIIWQGIPFFALMILAGLQGIPGELYEAADMDGATGFQKLFKITIPSIKNTIFITGLLRIIWVANSVDVIFNMTEGGPAYATQTLSVYVFNKAQALNLGYSSAMAILLALVLCLVAVPYLIFTFREEDK